MNANNLNQTPIHLDIHKIMKQLNIDDKKLALFGISAQDPSAVSANAVPGQKLVSSFS